MRVLFLFLSLILLTHSLKAFDLKENRMVSGKKKVKPLPPHLVKLNLSGLLFKSIGVQYEQKVRKRTGLAMGIIYRPMGSWFIARYYDTAAVSISQEVRYMYSSSRYRSFMLTPEYRHYFGRKAPKGFYLAPFLRSRFDKLSFSYHYFDEQQSVQKTASAHINETMLGLGVMAGLQIISRKHFGVDFWFAGPWVNYYRLHVGSKVNTQVISELQRKFIAQDMKEIINSDNPLTWNNDGIDSRHAQVSWGLRMLGINMCWNF